MLRAGQPSSLSVEDTMKAVAARTGLIVVVVAVIALAGCAPQQSPEPDPRADEELAALLVKLELQTRAVIAGHYVGADDTHREWLAENLLLPAAVADGVFYEVVPQATSGRAWVRMVVDTPRNPNNEGDSVALELLAELREGGSTAERSSGGAVYYAEPIKAAKTCLTCHGAPKGEPDPYFPMYEKDGWEEGQIIGAVVARVAQSGHLASLP
jgi:hypothetical protein